MKMTQKLLSLLLALILVLGLLPVTRAGATEAQKEDDVVYLSVSFDSNYINDKNGDPIVYVPVPLDVIAAIDLAEYGLDNSLCCPSSNRCWHWSSFPVLPLAARQVSWLEQ